MTYILLIIPPVLNPIADHVNESNPDIWKENDMDLHPNVQTIGYEIYVLIIPSGHTHTPTIIGNTFIFLDHR